MRAIEAYGELAARSREIAHLDSAMNLAYWDERTKIPVRGHAHRARHLAALSKMRHRRATDPIFGQLLAVVEDSALFDNPEAVEAVNLREWRRSYDRLTRIPEKLAAEIARAAAEGEAVWERTMPTNNWRRFRPYLERIVALKQKEAEALGYEDTPYDALLDEYEPGETTRNVESILNQLSEALITLLDRIQGSGTKPDSSLRQRDFPVPDQEAFAKEVARQLGYNLDAGRMDVSIHPFSTGIGPGDVRITARFRRDCFNEGLFAVVHEAGHAMYRQGLPLEYWGEPISRPVSLGIDESQSLLWENLVARSSGFWRHFYPLAQVTFPSLHGVPMDAFVLSINEVAPSLIRVNADEVTYSLHIVVRFDLERAMIAGDLQVSDLPDAWNAKMRTYLGLTPGNYAEGVMQDSHWASGAIGSFPSYALGYVYAAQLISHAERELGNLDSLFARGEFAALREWLHAKIWSQGSRYLARDLVRTVTGEDLNPQYLIAYLNEKYRALYAS